VAGHRAEFLNFGFFEPQPWRNFWHSHSFFEICYAYTGRGVYRVGEVAHPVEAGDLFVARPGDVHEIVADDADPLGIHFWAYTLVLQPPRRRAAVLERDVAADELLHAFASSSAAAVTRTVGKVPTLLELLSREAATPLPAFNEAVRALASTLIIDTARAIVGASPLPPVVDPGSRDEQVARTIVQYLEDNYDRPVHVRDVVAQVHLSERHANRLFRSAMGTTIHAYLASYRLEVAAQLLVEPGEAAIKEVAHSCGYPDVRHFTTAFRRRFGLAPAAFRARNGTTFV
jgi:AraC family L-rhamnose operon transcriptional activator RhaR